jgi:hypothetical protein
VEADLPQFRANHPVDDWPSSGSGITRLKLSRPRRSDQHAAAKVFEKSVSDAFAFCGFAAQYVDGTYAPDGI